MEKMSFQPIIKDTAEQAVAKSKVRHRPHSIPIPLFQHTGSATVDKLTAVKSNLHFTYLIFTYILILKISSSSSSSSL